MGMYTAASDRDYAMEHERPRRTNARCGECGREFVKARGDDGDLCEPCAYDAWVTRQERLTQAHRDDLVRRYCATWNRR